MTKVATANAENSEELPGVPARVLIVDNDRAHAEVVAEGLDGELFECRIATSGKEGAGLLDEDRFDVIVTDLVMNDGDGRGSLATAKEAQPEAEVILVTGHGTIESAVEAMQKGARDYLLKPLKLKELRAVVAQAAESARLRRDNLELKRRLDERFGFQGIIGNSPQMQDVINRLKRVAPTDATVLIGGETGTGKELVAQAIHQNSKRKNKPFVALNCGALTGNILESELFGHVKGAYTDATSDREGKFEYANGGTLFLDEVGEMPAATQVKLLRVMEDGQVTRLGANDTIKVNVRILAATNRDLEEAIERGEFRRDLYHRLKVISIFLPSLADRTEDIPLLTEHFMREHSKKYGKTVRSMTAAVRRMLLAYEWPGNVRELRNVIESMVVVDDDGVLDTDDLPPELAGGDDGPGFGPKGTLAGMVGKSLAEVEKRFVAETLRACGGNREDAARMLGVAPRTLYRKIKDYDIST